MPVTLDRVGHRWSGGAALFDGLDWTFDEGTVTALVGPSGSGKSTLLAILAGMVRPTEGAVRRPERCRPLWVFQNPHGVARRRVLDHVTMSFLARGADRRTADVRSLEVLERFGLVHRAHARFGELSGGEAQRLMLARGIASAPDLMLVDEPTAQLRPFDGRRGQPGDRGARGLGGRGRGRHARRGHPGGVRCRPRPRTVPVTGRRRERRMRPGEVAREAWRDIVSGAARAFTASVVLAVLLGCLVGLRTVGVVADVRAAEAYVASGAATTVQRAEGRIDGRTCDALAESGGVVASGALRRLERGVVPAALPGSAVPTYEVTSGVLGCSA
ncbi:ATP-binding cassette domain-containing protein [Curtobacterium flaccumfaciens]|nr:ATP-binding cassette domain-containing protein [Curtobacterium flaccumfaciens]